MDELLEAAASSTPSTLTSTPPLSDSEQELEVERGRGRATLALGPDAPRRVRAASADFADRTTGGSSRASFHNRRPVSASASLARSNTAPHFGPASESDADSRVGGSVNVGSSRSFGAPSGHLEQIPEGSSEDAGSSSDPNLDSQADPDSDSVSEEGG